MASSLAEFLTQSTTAKAHPAVGYLPIICYCGSENFRLARAGSATQRTCTRCGGVSCMASSADAWGDGKDEAWFFCQGCGGDKANICLGFAGTDTVEWFYVGVRCPVCGHDGCFNDGAAGGPMTESTFRIIAGEAPRKDA